MSLATETLNLLGAAGKLIADGFGSIATAFNSRPYGKTAESYMKGSGYKTLPPATLRGTLDRLGKTAERVLNTTQPPKP